MTAGSLPGGGINLAAKQRWGGALPLTATAVGTPALAMPVISCLRVIATSVLFLVRRLLFQLVGVRTVYRDPRNSSFHAALESLRCDPRGSAHRSRDCAH